MTCSRRMYWLYLILFTILAYPDLSFSGNENQRVQSALRDLKARAAGKIDVTWQKDKPRIRVLRGKLSVPYSGTPQQAAIGFLSEHADLFQLDYSLDDLRVESTRQPGGGAALTTIVRLKQIVSGVPVFDGGLEIYVTGDGSIDQVNNYYLPGLVVDPYPAVTAEQAVEVAKTNFMEDCTYPIDKEGMVGSCRDQPLVLNREPESPLGIYNNGDRPRLAYRLTLDVKSPIALIDYTIDANTGEILRKVHLIQNATGSGKVFDPNPANTLLQYGIVPRDDADANSNIFTNAYVTRTLNDITSQVIRNRTYYYLTGPYVPVNDSLEAPYLFNTTSGQISVTNGTFNFKRAADEFEHVMAYYHSGRSSRPKRF